MAQIIVGVGEYAVTNQPGDVVKTFALGSCVAMIVLAPRIRAVGMVHIALPESKLGNGKEKNLPGYFADTAIPVVLDSLKKLGISNNRDLIIKLAGGASMMDPQGYFNIGKRNVLAIRKILWQYKLGAIAEDIGQNFSRTVRVEVDTGLVYLSSPNRPEWQL